MSKKPPKYYIQQPVHCGQKLSWLNCGHRAGIGCPDCLGAGGWWEECPTCGYQPYGNDELLTPEARYELANFEAIPDN